MNIGTLKDTVRANPKFFKYLNEEMSKTEKLIRKISKEKNQSKVGISATAFEIALSQLI